jgi:hypothetical protein
MEDELDLDLDISWIHQHEKENSIDKNYCREPMNEITTYCVYINKELEIEKVTTEKMAIQFGMVSKERVLHFIQSKKESFTETKYRLLDMLLYNVELEPENIQSYSISENFHDLSKPFFKVLPAFDNVVIADSIFIFHSLNTLYFLFKEVERTPIQILKPILKKNKTHKIKETEAVDSGSSSSAAAVASARSTNNQTKKVLFHQECKEYDGEPLNKTRSNHRIETTKTRKYK